MHNAASGGAGNRFSTGWAFDRCPDVKSIGVGSHGPGTTAWIQHDELWALHLYRYHGEIEFDEGPLAITPGLLSIIPPATPFRRHYRSESSVHIFALFRLEEDRGTDIRLPWFRVLSDDFGEVNTWLEIAVGLFALSPLRAALRVWDVVLRYRILGDTVVLSNGVPQGDWLVDRFVQWVEKQLSEDCSLAQVTEAMGCSYTHLNNHVRRRLGVSVKKYMRMRRLERALNMMKYTAVPIKDVAASLGFDSLQSFNQFIHREAGASPRALRQGIRSRDKIVGSTGCDRAERRKQE